MDITHETHPFCAIPPSMIDGKKEIVDTCDTPINTHDTNKEQIMSDESQLNILYPIIQFNAFEFLSKYYRINDVSDFYKWLEIHKSSPVFTRIRLIDCFFEVYGKDITVTEDILTETIINIINNFWIKKMYRKLCQYVSIKNNNGFVIDPKKNKLNKIDEIVTRTDFLISHVITSTAVFEILNDYVALINKGNNKYELFYDFLLSSLINKLNKMI